LGEVEDLSNLKQLIKSHNWNCAIQRNRSKESKCKRADLQSPWSMTKIVAQTNPSNQMMIRPDISNE